MRQFGCKPGAQRQESDGEANQVLYPESFSQKRGVGSSAKTREGDRVLRASKEVCLVLTPFRPVCSMTQPKSHETELTALRIERKSETRKMEQLKSRLQEEQLKQKQRLWAVLARAS